MGGVFLHGTPEHYFGILADCFWTEIVKKPKMRLNLKKYLSTTLLIYHYQSFFSVGEI